jgi:hypothetical protein
MATTVYTELPVNAPCSYRVSRKSKLGRRWVRERGLGPGRNRIPCGATATRLIDGLPFCPHHNGLCGSDRRTKKPSKLRGSSRHAIDPYYDSVEWRTLRKLTLQRDQHLCQYCGSIAHQADHVIPRRRGGPDGGLRHARRSPETPRFSIETRGWVPHTHPHNHSRRKVTPPPRRARSGRVEAGLAGVGGGGRRERDGRAGPTIR